MKRLATGCCLVAVASSAEANTPKTVKVAIVSAENAEFLHKRILLDAQFKQSEIGDASVLWSIGSLGPDQLRRVMRRVRHGGATLILVPGNDLRGIKEAIKIDRTSLRSRRASAKPTRHASSILREQVVWASAPQIGKRWWFSTHPAAKKGVNKYRTLVVEKKSSKPLISEIPLGRGRVVFVASMLNDPSNREFVLWPYFNYLLYALTCHAASVSAKTFGHWSHSPVPHSSTLLPLVLLLGIAWLITMVIFQRVRRYSREHPLAIEGFFPKAPNAQDIVKGPRREAIRDTWKLVGFSRSLAGFLTLVGILFILFAPFFWLTNMLIPNQIQPFPQAKGIWDFAWQALQVAWFLFDAGTFVAFVKYFAEFRHKDPAEALRSAQFFVWWQMITGLVQVTLACLAAVLILPHTQYGYTSTFVMLVVMGQFPGFFGVLTFFFQAYQRYDYNIGLDLLSDWVLRFALQIPCILLFRRWGQANPEYGEALGAAIGIGVGFYLATVVTFFFGLVLYRRLGLRLSPLFMVHFNKATAKRMLSYGLRVVAGSTFFRMAKTVEHIVISLLLINYTEWLGIESQIHWNLMFLFPIAYRFFETAVAALSESYSNEKFELTRYYVVRFLQVGAFYAAIGVSLLWSLGPMFVKQAMDPQWLRAADYLAIAALIGIFQAPAWLSDMLQKGAGRPGLFAMVLAAEQTLRIILFFVLIPRYQFTGFYLAVLITLVLKVVCAWIINHKLLLKIRLYWWQIIVAPCLVAVGNFVVWRLCADTIAPTGRIDTMVFFFSASLLSFVFCFFLLGLFGGVDRYLASELAQAAQMTGVLRPLSRLFYGAAKFGWTLSPLHDRFPVTLYDAAMTEAASLQQ